MNLFKMGVSSKMISLLLAFALIPLAVISFSVLNSFSDIREQAAERFEVAALSIADKIDRNLFERYGDVQAFALNEVIQNRSNWYKIPEEDFMLEAAIVEAMDSYVQTYGIYLMTILVDLEGNVIAVNSTDAAGNPIDSSGLYDKNFSSSAWFRALESRNFTTRMPFTAPGNDISTGTYIEDLHIDTDVKSAYTGNDGLVVSFSTPVYDHNGNAIAYWSNRADFGLVEEIVKTEYRSLKDGGFPGAEITVLDKDGRIIVDYDPATRKTLELIRDIDAVILKLNLASAGVDAAVSAVNGRTGHNYSLHARKQIVQAGGYTHLKGALGYPGMNWSVLVRVPEDEAAPWMEAIQTNITIILLVCIAIVAAVGMFVGRGVVGDILQIVTATEKAAEGDLRVRINLQSKDEFGQLAAAFNSMLDKIGEVVTEVREGSNAILSASNEVARGNVDLSQRSEEQATSLEETASSMEEMTTTVKQNSDSADQANQLALDARAQAEKGGEVVSQTEIAMGAINESSKKIADIISVIDEIAFQTNLLALNAAVEAARAGDQGRGFAVVAGEVRTLAQRSADAAKEIKDLILDSVDKVDQGTHLVSQSGTTLNEIIDSIKSAADLVAEIAAASRQQSTGIEQVNSAVMQMNDMTQENSALVEEASAASRSMEEQANRLIDMIEFFKTDDEAERQVRPITTGSAAFDRDRISEVSPAGNPNNAIQMGKQASVTPGGVSGKAASDSEWDEF